MMVRLLAIGMIACSLSLVGLLVSNGF